MEVVDSGTKPRSVSITVDSDENNEDDGDNDDANDDNDEQNKKIMLSDDSDMEIATADQLFHPVEDFRKPHGMKRSFVERLHYVQVSPEPIYDENGVELEDERDPQMCEEYADEIYEFMYMQQEQYMVDPCYMDNLPAGFQWQHNRHTLINWMLTIHRKFRLVAETLFLATNIVDRYLSTTKHVKLEDVQLIASTALFIAAKYEEVITPAVSNFAYVANSTAESVRAMEKKVLVGIEFDLGTPSPLNYLRRISRADDYQMNTRTIAKFLLEISLFEPKLMVYRPSDVAAAAMYTSRQILRKPGWPTNFVYYSGGCTKQGLMPIVEIMREYLKGPCDKRDESFIVKYSSKRMLQAATLSIAWARSGE